jgi:hypothetical protein
VAIELLAVAYGHWGLAGHHGAADGHHSQVDSPVPCWLHWWTRNGGASCWLGIYPPPWHACNDATAEAASTASGEGPSFGGGACLGVAACVWASSFGGGACFGVAACVWASSFGDSACFGVGVTTFTDFGGVYPVSIADASIADACVGASFARGGSCA